MKSGTLFENDAARELLVRNNLESLDAVYEQGDGAHLRHTGRAVWDTHLTDSDGRELHVYLKMNWGRRRLWPRMTDLKTGQWLQSMPVREWHGIETLGRLGLNVPERVAVMHEGLVSFRSAVIVRAIPPVASMFDLLKSGDWAAMKGNDRGQILQVIARVMRTIHAAGLGWRGTSVGHFYPAATPGGTWDAWLIDCEGVHRSRTQKTIDRDDRKLIRSFDLAGADSETLSQLVDCLQRETTGELSRAA